MAEDPKIDSDFSARLNRLIETVHPRWRGPYTDNEIAAAIGVSRDYIAQLRKGLRTNPTMRVIQALADFFKVPVTYFFPGQQADRIDLGLLLLAVLREAGVRGFAARVDDLSDDSRQVIAEMVEELRLPGISTETMERLLRTVDHLRGLEGASAAASEAAAPQHGAPNADDRVAGEGDRGAEEARP